MSITDHYDKEYKNDTYVSLNQIEAFSDDYNLKEKEH